MLPFGIDQMSVATQGHFEGLVTPVPVVSSPRDELRVATLGWIIIDFISLPDPNLPTDALIEPFVACPIVEDPRGAVLVRSFRSEALLPGDGQVEVRIIALVKGEVIVMDESGSTARIPAKKLLAELEAGADGAIIRVKRSELDIIDGTSDADVEPGSTDTEENP